MVLNFCQSLLFYKGFVHEKIIIYLEVSEKLRKPSIFIHFYTIHFYLYNFKTFSFFFTENHYVNDNVIIVLLYKQC